MPDICNARVSALWYLYPSSSQALAFSFQITSFFFIFSSLLLSFFCPYQDKINNQFIKSEENPLINYKIQSNNFGRKKIKMLVTNYNDKNVRNCKNKIIIVKNILKFFKMIIFFIFIFRIIEYRF